MFMNARTGLTININLSTESIHNDRRFPRREEKHMKQEERYSEAQNPQISCLSCERGV
jgi:hypothetical protein